MQTTNIKPLLAALMLSYGSLALANTNNWQPVASETLLSLPANLIEKRIQQDFSMSPMAQDIMQIEQQVAATGEQIQGLQGVVKDAKESEMVPERVELLQLKSQFLDLMQQGQQLRQQALSQKQQVYEDVLTAMLQKQNQASHQDMVKLKQQQDDARARMQAVIEQVDQTLMLDGYNKQSPYADEFAHNLNKIDQLKQAIAAHKASMAPTIDGVEVTAQEYVRQLLMQASGEQSLLDQEALMLSYMAKLVALDAQSLEYNLAYQEEQNGESTTQLNKAASAADLFL